MSYVTMTGCKETINHAVFVNKIAFAYSAILCYVLMDMKGDFLLSVDMSLRFDLPLE